MIPLTVLFLIALAAFILTIVSTMKPIPLWIPVLIVTIYLLLQSIPLGK